MILRLPSYYKDFSCIADRCQESCCLGWEIDIDEDTFEYYRTLKGPFGDRLRENMTKGSVHSFRLKKGNRCPFLNERNLCDIVLALGETSLCEICTEYPRFTLDYADVRERCLSVSCEEVGRILFSRKEPTTFEETVISEASLWDGEEEDLPQDDEFEGEEEFSQADDSEGGDDLSRNDDSEGEGEFSQADDSEGEDDLSRDDEGEMGCEVICDFGEEDSEDDEELLAGPLQHARDRAVELLQDRTRPIEERVCQYLLFCEKVQSKLNDEDPEGIEAVVLDSKEDAEVRVDKAAFNNKSRGEAFDERSRILEGMEILDEHWKDAFAHMKEVFRELDKEGRRQLIRNFMEFYRDREYEYEQLMVYFSFRYLMKSVFDYRFLSRAQLAVISFLAIRDMDAVRFADQGGSFTLADRIDNAKIWSREVEHSEDNLEYLAESFVYESCLKPEELCRQVLWGTL